MLGKKRIQFYSTKDLHTEFPPFTETVDLTETTTRRLLPVLRRNDLQFVLFEQSRFVQMRTLVIYNVSLRLTTCLRNTFDN